MKLKLDENLGRSAKRGLSEAGHDVIGAREQGLGGASDADVARVCGGEGRCLVTLDLDFASILRFPPSSYAGIAVLRIPEPLSSEGISAAVDTLTGALEDRSPAGKLWIIRAGRVREYEEPSE